MNEEIELNLNDLENILWALDHLINTLSDEFKDKTVEETHNKVLKLVGAGILVYLRGGKDD